MRTDALIDVLATDNRKNIRPLGLVMAAWIVCGAFVSAILLHFSIGIRPDIVVAMGTWRFVLKMALLVAATAMIARTSISVGRPITINVRPICIGLAALLASAVALEVAVTPRAEWGARWLGTNAVTCVVAIPALSVAPLAALLMFMRSAAPSSPGRAGAVLGAMAAAVGATLYGTHCIDDSALFVATWYACGALPIVVLGTFLGRRLLQW